MRELMTGAVRQPFILCNSVISIYLCLSPDFPRCKRVQWSGERLPLGACGQTEDVIYFPANCAGVTNISSHYNLSPGVKIYRWHRRMRFSSASQKRLPTCFLSSDSVTLYTGHDVDLWVYESESQRYRMSQRQAVFCWCRSCISH